MQVDARAGRVVAVGAAGSDTMPRWLAFERRSISGWTSLPKPATAFDLLPFDVALDATGRAVFAGGVTSLRNLQPGGYDERTGSLFGIGVEGFFQAIAFGVGDTVRAVGSSAGGSAQRSVTPGNWQSEDLGITTPPQEAGLVDLHVNNGVFYGCGFNDAGPEFAILMRNRGTGWESIPVGNLATIELRAVVADSTGAVWLGGVDQASDPPSAFLARRPANGDWFEVVLPPMTGAVRDILVTTTGEVYLATGNVDAQILRWDGMTWVAEVTRQNTRILALAESNDRLVAVGVANTGTDTPQPLVLERSFF